MDNSELKKAEVDKQLIWGVNVPLSMETENMQSRWGLDDIVDLSNNEATTNQ